MNNNTKPLLSTRGQMALMGGGMWLLLAFWSISAFWEHIDELQPTYPNAARMGAMGAEFALFCLLMLHCYHHRIGVRKWALIFTFCLTLIIIAHAGALRGLKEATITQRNTETRMAEALGKMSAQQAEAIRADQGGTQRERIAKQRAALAQKAEVAKSAQKEVAATINNSAETVKHNSIFPKWYLDGWMYSALFLAAMLFLSITFGFMMRGEDDIDANYDGILDSQQASPHPMAAAPYPVAAQDHRKQIGFPTSAPNTTFTVNQPTAPQRKQPEADDPKGPPPHK